MNQMAKARSLITLTRSCHKSMSIPLTTTRRPICTNKQLGATTETNRSLEKQATFHDLFIVEMPPRITSYNVCYTKLLRPLAVREGGVSRNWALMVMVTE